MYQHQTKLLLLLLTFRGGGAREETEKRTVT